MALARPGAHPQKVSGKTKVEIRDKPRELRKELDVGLRPRQRYTVGNALDDWLTHGVDGLSERTVTLYRDTMAKALKEELGAVRPTELNAGDLKRALAAMAPRSSTWTLQIAHSVLVRAIRQAERDDLVARNVASLVKPPKGQLDGRPSKSLTLEQTVALMAAARGVARPDLPGVQPRRAAHLREFARQRLDEVFLVLTGVREEGPHG
ncbi:MAG TPA: hypothetical protein VHZ03_06275 [Trebonia sp.]|nr:hypothetical protein [Trebonia sp.]